MLLSLMLSSLPMAHADLMFRPAAPTPPVVAPANVAPADVAVAPPVVTDEVRLVTWLWDVGHGLSLELEQSERVALLSEAIPGGFVGTLDAGGGTYRRYAMSRADVGGVQAGSSWRVLHEGGEARCTVTGFEAIASEHYTPGDAVDWGAAPCMAPMIVATLACDMDVDFALAAVPTSNTAAAVAEPVTVGTFTAPAGALNEYLTHPVVQQVQQDAALEARLRGAPLKSETSSQRYALNGQHVEVIRGRWFTGQGDEGCDGGDIVREWAAVVVDGQLLPPRETTGGNIYGVLDVEGDGQVELLEWSGMSTRVLRNADGSPRRADAVEWCICGC
ncbi:MAG: hypothetical protein AAFV53_35100 [Myxococcota bacterium]